MSGTRIVHFLGGSEGTSGWIEQVGRRGQTNGKIANITARNQHFTIGQKSRSMSSARRAHGTDPGPAFGRVIYFIGALRYAKTFKATGDEHGAIRKQRSSLDRVQLGQASRRRPQIRNGIIDLGL